MEKPLPQLYQTKMKICYEQYRICHSKELKSLSILLADVFLRVPGVFFFFFFHDGLGGLVPSIPASMFVRFEQNLWERFRDILG